MDTTSSCSHGFGQSQNVCKKIQIVFHWSIFTKRCTWCSAVTQKLSQNLIMFGKRKVLKVPERYKKGIPEGGWLQGESSLRGGEEIMCWQMSETHRSGLQLEEDKGYLVTSAQCFSDLSWKIKSTKQNCYSYEFRATTGSINRNPFNSS